MFVDQRQLLSSVYVIVPVYNRIVTTLRCLARLTTQDNSNTYHIIVIDDGSTDGTAKEVSRHYPAVSLLKGDGNLWWTGAIRLGMEYAMSKGASYCVWLNDDTLPEAGAVQALVDYCNRHPKTIAAANTLDPHTHEPSYGGVIRQKLKIVHVFSKAQQPVSCEGLSGNLTCLPTGLIETIGYPDDTLYPHYYGDVIYTHRAKQAGYQLVLLHDAVAYCENDHAPIEWFRSNQSLIDIIRDRQSIKSPHYWKAHLAYYKTFLGVFGVPIYIYEVWIKMLLLVMAKRVLFLLPVRRALSSKKMR